MNLPLESTIFFDSPSLRIGSFRCTPSSGLWKTENISGVRPLVVFPRTAVEIHQAGRQPVVATPNHVMLYNSSQPYRRDLIDPRGDVCEFYSVAPTVIEESLQAIGSSLPRVPDIPFELTHSPCSAKLYAAQSTFFRAIKNEDVCDPIFIEEQFFQLLAKLMEQTSQFHDPFTPRKKHIYHIRRDHVEAAKDFISRNFRMHLNLNQIADSVDCSVFHLCRIFKEFTGKSIHNFLLEFRLRSAIERVLDGNNSLTKIALDHGFSSHSHFTDAFRQRFGSSPNEMRQRRLAASCQQLIADLQVASG